MYYMECMYVDSVVFRVGMGKVHVSNCTEYVDKVCSYVDMI